MLSQSWPFSNIQAERTGAGGAAGASVGAAGTGWKPGNSKQTFSIFDLNQNKVGPSNIWQMSPGARKSVSHSQGFICISQIHLRIRGNFKIIE